MADIAAALTVIDNFESNDTAPIAWQLDRAATLNRLRSLIQIPNEFNQRGLNACGPAVFFRVWLARDPVAVATFACGLLRDGRAQIGALSVAPSWKLLGQNYALLRATIDSAHPGATPETAEWMLLSALRDSENIWFDYAGEPYSLGDAIAGMTLPGTLAGWLSATGLFQSVADETSVIQGTDPARLLSMIPTSNIDIILFVNSAPIYVYSAPITGAAPSATFLAVPNHYILVNGPFAMWSDPAWLEMDCWSWGKIIGGWQGSAFFFSNYFGQLIATTP
jgi:hypothetical protein